MFNIYNFTYEELSDEFTKFGIPKFRAKQVWNWLYVNCVQQFSEMTNISKKDLAIIEEHFVIHNYEIIEEQIDTDFTQKAVIELSDKEAVEAVLMNHNYGYSVCVTTQVGCRIGCKFCASHLNGLKRNLETGEIVAQVVHFQRQLLKHKLRVSHIVVMGIGEPFENYDNVIKFLDILNDQNGLKIGARHMTVSTSGLVPKILEFANYDKQVNLAISLHSAIDEIRSDIMPINRKYPIDDLLDAVEEYQWKTNRQVTFEYVMLAGVNDSVADAQALVRLVRDIDCHINLIPYNNVDENDFKSSNEEVLKTFLDVLVSKKVRATIRYSKGQKIDGACGQLRNKVLKEVQK